MTLSFIRVFFLLISGLVGYYIGMLLFQPLLGLEIGLFAALLLIFLETRLRRVSVRGLSSMVFGLLLGVFMAKLLADVIEMSQPGPFIMSVTRIVLTVMFSYLGAVMALRGKDEFNIIIPYVRFRRQDVKEGIILLDTSAIIDGRIADIYKLNFLIGRLVVPRFVLQEMQRLADSSDDIKRQRGRRGLELLRLMQNDPKVDVHIHEDDMIEEKQDVDAKLVALAKIMDARVCTTDFNLSQSASLRDIEILNVNELANAVKSVIFIGEELKIKLVKEGKEPTQAVGYLEDGTMVVVSDGRRLIGQLVKTVVTSVLQTQSGKMIFAKTAPFDAPRNNKGGLAQGQP